MPHSKFAYPILSYDVYDGDTVKAVIDQGWVTTKGFSIRVDGIDTPEVRTRNKLHKAAGKKGFKAHDGRGKVCVSDDHELTVTRESFPVRDQGAIGSSVAQAQSAVNEFMHLKEMDPDFIYKTKGGE